MATFVGWCPLLRRHSVEDCSHTRSREAAVGAQGLGKVPECLVHGLVIPSRGRTRVASRAVPRSTAAMLRWPCCRRMGDGEGAQASHDAGGGAGAELPASSARVTSRKWGSAAMPDGRAHRRPGGRDQRPVALDSSAWPRASRSVRARAAAAATTRTTTPAPGAMKEGTTRLTATAAAATLADTNLRSHSRPAKSIVVAPHPTRQAGPGRDPNRSRVSQGRAGRPACRSTSHHRSRRSPARCPPAPRGNWRWPRRSAATATDRGGPFGGGPKAARRTGTPWGTPVSRIGDGLLHGRRRRTGQTKWSARQARVEGMRRPATSGV